MSDYTDSVMTLGKALQQRDEARAQRDELMRLISAKPAQAVAEAIVGARYWLHTNPDDENAPTVRLVLGAHTHDVNGIDCYMHREDTRALSGEKAGPQTLANFVHLPDAERVAVGQQVAASVDATMSEKAVPVGDGEMREPQGTFECPVCGHDRPHHHDEDNRFPWHMQYREAFERIVHSHIRQIGREWFIGGMRLNGRNMWLGRVGPDARVETGWAEIERSGQYKNQWLQTLWEIFQATVQLALPASTAPDKEGK